MNKLISVLIFVSCFLISGFGQESIFNRKKKDPLVKMDVKKNGVYVGLQQGIYTFAELGGEFQYKRIKLKDPFTLAASFGAEYNYTHNTLGFNAGAWKKPGRFDFTYGLNLVYRSNFEQNKLGVGPVLGYKIFGLHLQTGYIFHTPASDFITHNDLFITARFLFVKNSDRNIQFRKKNT